MADEITTSGNESLNEAMAVESMNEAVVVESEPLEPVETEEERQAREEAARLAAEEAESLAAEAAKVAEEAARLAAAEAEHAALVESQKPEAIRLLSAIRAGVPAEAGAEEGVATAFAALDPAACAWADAELNERARLALAESQKEQAFRCWHHIMTSPKPRDEVRQHLLLLEPEALMHGKEKIEAELAALAKEKAEADEAGFSMPVTPAEASVHDTPKRRGGRGR